ncbi:MAG: TPR end-of-group domain-containing protein [Flavobacteriaceae bacterium]
MNYRAFIFFFLWTVCLFSQTETYLLDVISDSIVIKEKRAESFALYLPETYDTETAFPIVFIFDPGGRGKTGLAPFIKAAKKYQLIIVCSNSSRNTAYDENFAIADRWFNDVFTRFKIDQKRIYAAGFSGGARMASAIGVISGAFKGIVGCGAAFSGTPGQMPYASDHFYYAGLVGNLDMNYQEMIKAGQWLNKIGLANEIITFKGDHRWPDANDIVRAFDWFQLQDMNNGILKENPQFLEALLLDRVSIARNFEQDGQLLDAASSYDNIVDDLGRYFALDSIASRSAQLKQLREYKKAVKERDHIAKEEKAWNDKLIGKIREEIVYEEIPGDFNWWQKELRRLKENYTESDRKSYQEMGRRIQSVIFAVAIESMQASAAGYNEKEVDYYAALMAALWPKNPYVFFRISSSYASLGKKNEALANLEKAIDKGWVNKQWILNSKAFRSLKGNYEFELLLKQLQ